MSELVAIVIVVILLWALPKAIMIVPEGTLVKVFKLGKYDRSFSSGLHIGWFDKSVAQRVFLKVGSVGVATSGDTVEFEGYQIPVKFLDMPRIGAPARIEKFVGIDPMVTHDNVPNEKEFRCEKCGHMNKVRV